MGWLFANQKKTHLTNPQKGYFATANQNITPENYTHWDAIGYIWSDPFRGDRLNEVLGSKDKLNMTDMKALQTDYYSIPARKLIPFLNKITFGSARAVRAKKIVSEWETQIMHSAQQLFVPEKIREILPLQLTKVIYWIYHPEKMFNPPAEKNRDLFLKNCFILALDILTQRLGNNMDHWQYGQPDYKHIVIFHAFNGLVKDKLAKKLNTDTIPRGGNAYCPCITGSLPNQTRGASFRNIINTGNWDGVQAINTPGQSGNPDSPYYKNLFHLWGNDEYFPLYYTKEKIKTVVTEEFILTPR